MDSMRPEQSYCLITGEMSIEYSAFESGLVNTGLKTETLGERYKAKVIAKFPYDSENEKLTA